MIGTPEGSADRLFAECTAWRRVQRAVTELFQRRGYSELMTPETEYYDLFVAAGYPLPQESMMKVIDRSGRILVMRPDNTTPIARLTAAKLRGQPLPQRLYYNQSVYRSDDAHTGRSAATAQCGVELIGAGGLRADVEVAALAVQAVEAAGVEEFQLELGCVGFFSALAAELDAPGEVIAAMRRCIEEKNFTGYGELLEPYRTAPAGRALAELPRLFGGFEALRRARTLCCNPAASEALDLLETVYAQLQAAGLGDRLRFDLGLVQRLDYYTGLVFRAYARGSGSALLSGGRYDRLIGRLGYDVPAVGFAVDIAALSQCLPEKPVVPPELLVYYEQGFLGAALALVDAQAPGTAALCVSECLSGAEQEARRLGAKRLFVLGSDGERSVAL